MTGASRRGTFGVLALLIVLGAIWWLGAGLACAAAYGREPRPAHGLCAPRFGWHVTPPAAPTAREIPFRDQLYAALLDTLYHPQRYANLVHGGGFVLIESRTVTGLEYLHADTVARALRRLAPDAAEQLATDFRAANAAREDAPWLGTYHALDVRLDSATARQLLGDGHMTAAARMVADNVLAGLPIDSLPDIVAISRPAISIDGDTALLYATLRSRQSTEADHLEAAAYILMHRDGARWSLAGEIPLPRARAR